ncbi:MAG: L-seryl-tRNA(Sec) selenium transferase [Chitinispirillaceae bacterium]
MPNSEQLRKLPGVDKLLQLTDFSAAIDRFGRQMVTGAMRQVLGDFRSQILGGGDAPSHDVLVDRCLHTIEAIGDAHLRPVINATGIALHTNLGRSPLGESLLNELCQTVTGYTNLEFDLSTGKRGHRNDHMQALLNFLTGAQSTAVVNNNAAAVMLVLSTLAKDREVIVSRGELIEIGGAFRIPDIVAASGARMVEVGTTNRTRLADYQNAITDQTALLFKAHKSNYAIIGFTEEVTVGELSGLGKEHSLPTVYDIGSGLLRKPANLPLENEPDVKTALEQGADLVTFSGDKLLGGPQAGIIAGRAELVTACKNAPLMRALRVGKLTIAALISACRHYLTDDSLTRHNPLFGMLEQSIETIDKRAHELQRMLQEKGVRSKITDSGARVGGGTLPNLCLPSRAVALVAPRGSTRQQQRFAEDTFEQLLVRSPAVVSVLREGKLILDCFTLSDSQLETVTDAVSAALGENS